MYESRNLYLVTLTDEEMPDMIKEYDCDTVVVGLPKKLDGTDSPQTEKVREFKTMLENKMRSTGMVSICLILNFS